MGHSMGGFTTAGIFVRHPELKTAVNINGSSAYEKSLELMVEPFKDDISKEQLEACIRDIRAYDPIKHKEAFKERPYLIIHGEKDEVVPKEGQEYFYEQIKKVAPEKLRFTKYPRVNHYITIGMLEEALLWLKDNLG